MVLRTAVPSLLAASFLALFPVNLPGRIPTRVDRFFDAAGAPLTAWQLNVLLQQFADQVYGKGFRELGEERDCDHGHLLYSTDAARPFAVLYHTQEVPAPGPNTRRMPARNWLQWVGTGRVEDARRYLRTSYPATAYWDWFQTSELPRLKPRGTVVHQMLDPMLMGTQVAESRQWVFTRVACDGPPPTSRTLQILLPDRRHICLEPRSQ